MIQQRPPTKKKTMVSIAIIAVMVFGMLRMLFGSSGSPDTFIPAESGTSVVMSPTNTKLDDRLFQNPLFQELTPLDGMVPIDQTRIGRANPFVPISSVKNP